MIYSGLGVNWSNVRNDCRYFNNLSHTVHLRQECMYFLFNRTTLLSFSYAYWTVHHLDIWIKVDQLDDTCFIMSIYCSTWVVVQPALGYHITNSQSRYITPTRLESAQYSLHNNTPSRKLLKMDVLTSETCWAVNWRNKASVIKLVYLYSKNSKFLLHTLQLLYMCTLYDSTNINTIIEFIPNCL